ncbi:Ran-specific GTPase-activating [Cordyceps militaris]|uniref:Ran-specific GTPase-activating n=1 Tax=Cordyceps militaris TaxID=73501 RepID=A0A2H4S890_CORMI|nr:Ran-specific GTPase-activating [Cordyceps militaris]
MVWKLWNKLDKWGKERKQKTRKVPRYLVVYRVGPLFRQKRSYNSILQVLMPLASTSFPSPFITRFVAASHHTHRRPGGVCFFPCRACCGRTNEFTPRVAWLSSSSPILMYTLFIILAISMRLHWLGGLVASWRDSASASCQGSLPPPHFTMLYTACVSECHHPPSLRCIFPSWLEFIFIASTSSRKHHLLGLREAFCSLFVLFLPVGAALPAFLPGLDTHHPQRRLLSLNHRAIICFIPSYRSASLWQSRAIMAPRKGRAASTNPRPKKIPQPPQPPQPPKPERPLVLGPNDKQRKVKIVADQRVIDKPSSMVEFPMREWSLRLFLLDDEGNEHPGDVFTKVVYHLHPTFKNPVQTFTKSPFACTNEGWGEFEIGIDCYTTEKTKLAPIVHDLNFAETKYESVHTVVFKNPSQALQERLRETGPLPTDEDRPKKKSGLTGSKKSGQKYDYEKIAEALEKLEEEELLRVIQLINEHKGPNTYIRSDIDVDDLDEAGEFSIDLYTMPDLLTTKLWDHLTTHEPGHGVDPYGSAKKRQSE